MDTINMLGHWDTLDCIGQPSPRHENGFVACDGNFYLVGGRGIKPVDEFDPATNTWRAGSPPPLELHHFQPVSVGDTIFIIGAMTGGYPRETPVEHIYTYHPATDTWTVLPDAPRVRDHFPVTLVDERLYAVGGRNTRVHTEADFAAFFHATIHEIDYYDFEQGAWFMLEIPLPVGTAAGGIAELDGNLLYFGGESGQRSAHAETQCYDFRSGTWEQLAPMRQGRHGSQSVVFGNAVFIAAGCGNRGGSPELDTIERFSFSGRE